MRTCIFLAVVATAVLTSCNNRRYVIEGTFSGSEDSVCLNRKAYLFSEFSDVEDSVDIIDGKFKFSGRIEQPVQYFIGIEGMLGIVDIFLENASYSAEIIQNGEWLSLHSYVSGGETQDVFYRADKAYNDALDLYGFDMDNILDDSIEDFDGLMEAIAEAESARDIVYDAYEAEFPVSYFSLARLYQNMEDMTPENIADKIYLYSEDERFLSNPMYEAIYEYILSCGHLSKGRLAPDFTVPDTEGRDVTFSSVYPRNKVTAIVFWASWGPFMDLNLTLKELYEKYHDKGLEIVSISIDNDGQAWRQEIEDLGLYWIHLSDLAFWDTEPRKLYNVSHLPEIVLVDSGGIIIATKLDVHELESILKDLLE